MRSTGQGSSKENFAPPAAVCRNLDEVTAYLSSYESYEPIKRVTVTRALRIDRNSTVLLEYGAVDEDEEWPAQKYMQGEQNERQDDDVGGTEIEGDDSSGGGGSEDEWASAQEDVEDM
ncbi:hypothetical protein FIBSPDRAFT_886701 [Athelia psychrophila]|uniref:Uncharacterized protein n=1 Tax=Athelia psychrophila TaxID=1759441 RepID=A0A166QF72_9AGAM|nr:hypothetical protein FIBSPDRAFT_886701 [Fibularhizoctonia sp. CBS 109695]